MASSYGSIEIDFGSAPGLNETTVAVTGQTAINSLATIDVFIMGNSSTSNHTTKDHQYAENFINFSAGNIVNGVGFTIYAVSEHKMTGKFLVNWVWVL